MWVTPCANSAQLKPVSLLQIATIRNPPVTRFGVASGSMSNDLRHRLGRLGEQLAADHLARCGFEILQRNYRTRWGELDIVAFDGRTLAFCEVN